MSGRGWSNTLSDLAAGLLVAAVSAISIAGNMSLTSPPRFDGAGYAILGEAIRTGQGYRELDRPGSPRHAHFPPGYPAALASIWLVTGRSVPAAHVFSMLCTVTATVLGWRWLRQMYSRRIALAMGLALAVNWTWGRSGSVIQSEPLYLLIQQIGLLMACATARRGGFMRGALLGLLLVGAVLTRHVGVCLVLAVSVDLWLRTRTRALAGAWLVMLLLMAPWAAWLMRARQGTQPALLVRGALIDRLKELLPFYVQRLPDQLIGPVAEIATVFQSSGRVAFAANVLAAVGTAVLVLGWTRALLVSRRRLAGLVAFTTLALLVVWPFTEAGRFLIPLVPMLLVGAVEGLNGLALRGGVRRFRIWAAWAVLVASVPYAGYAIATRRAEALRQTHRDFDAACAWLAQNGREAGLVLSRHPGEVYWQTGRQGMTVESTDPEVVRRQIDRERIAYLLIDEDRYVNAEDSPIRRFVEQYPARVERVWIRETSGSESVIYRVLAGLEAEPSNRSTP